jgi:4-amino-4-deoxy-L-arabinose transferase-like glycosyltransferase
MVYIHIARLTAASGDWLPLLSDIANLLNTKPPLLFWQAMVAGDWGHNWSLLALRLPSIVYTFVTAAGLGLLAWRIRRDLRAVCLTVLLYLLFFSTFRYGRVYLTSAPETFWLGLPLYWLLWVHTSTDNTQKATFQGFGPVAYTLFGLAMGLGLAYKSFALIAPASATLWLAILLSATPQQGKRLPWSLVWKTTLGVGWSVVLALGIFSLWFVLDPDPASVWAEFVVGENAGKMSGQKGYWHAALHGDYPMWQQLFAYPENAGLLALPVLGMGWFGLRQLFGWRRLPSASPAMVVLLVWLAVWLIVFTIPSQRSARYVIPAMPALALVMGLYWDRIAKPWHWLTVLVLLPALLIMARIAWVIQGMDVGSTVTGLWALLTLGSGMLLALWGLVRPRWSGVAALTTCLAIYAGFGAMVEPLSGPQAAYPPQVKQQLNNALIAVPNGFTGQYERYQFVLPGNRFNPYDIEGRNTGALKPELPPRERLAYLLAGHDAVVWLQEDLAQTQPSCVPACTVIGARWHVKSRHKSGEVTLDNLWYPQQWLFRREWLIIKAK